MRIKAIGFILTLIFGIVIAYLISVGAGFFLDPSVVIDPTAHMARFVRPEVVYQMIQALGEMLWHYRGIDMVLQGVFLFVAALAASVFFHETVQESTERKEKE